MALGRMWSKTLVYFGLADEDEDYEDEALTVQPDVESAYRERASVRKIERTGRRRQTADFDDIFADDEYRGQRGSAAGQRVAPVRPLAAAVEQPQVRVHLVTPKNFNDAQTVADKFKRRHSGHSQSADQRDRIGQEAHRLCQWADVRARRGHAAGGRQGLPADSQERRGLGGGAPASRGQGLLQPVLAAPACDCPAG